LSAGLQSAIDEMTNVQNENDQLKAQLDQKDRLLEEMRDEVVEAKRVSKEMEPYKHIIEEEPKKTYLLHVTDPLLMREIRMKAVKVLGPGGDQGSRFTLFTKKLLWEAVGTQWPFIRKRAFDRTDA